MATQLLLVLIQVYLAFYNSIMPKRVDLTGKRFGRWTVLEYAGKSRWKCLCDCGTVAEVNGSNLRRGLSVSCKCYNKEVVSSMFATHGRTKTREHRIWKAMHQRCSNPNNAAYKDYGGRGISVCERWADFANFYSDIGPIAPGLSIDRIDNNGNYEPSNVRLATQRQQANNTRSNRLIEYQGITQTLTQWAEQMSIPTSTLFNRLEAGRSGDELFN